MKKNLGTVLKELRKKKKLTAKEAVDKLLSMGYEISDKTLSGYETGIRMPNADVFMALCKIYDCKNILEMFSFIKADYSIPTDDEWNIIEKYRFISENSADGANVVDSILDREYAIASRLHMQNRHIKEMTATSATLIELPAPLDGKRRSAEYFYGASAGTGIFILGNEDTSKIILSESDWDDRIDYVIRVNGDSMMPDYCDGDNVKVSQRVEINHGDVGIFVVNGKAYIKEYGETELISRNPNSPNIKISEYDNIVCMGKIIGKLEENFKIIDD